MWRLSLVALPLLISCSERSATAPSAVTGTTTRPSISPAAGSTAVFTVEPTLMTIPTYDGSGQAVHPDVVAFDSNWHGARYWITMTPYPKSAQTLENPSILTSDDGESVTVPDGVKNPVVKAPNQVNDYNSDPELLYESQTDRLVLFYRLVSKGKNSLHVTTSHDGVHWSTPRVPLSEPSHRAVSPTIAPRSDGPARMWYVNAGKDGCSAKSTSVITRLATNTTGRIVDTKWEATAPTDLSIPGYSIWHIKARWVPEKSEYWMLISAFPNKKNGCHTDDLFFARSTDGLHWTTYQEPVIRHDQQAWTAAAVYRSTFLYDAGDDELKLWVSGRGVDGAWHMGYARVQYASMMAALEAGRPLSNRVTAFVPIRAHQLGEEP